MLRLQLLEITKRSVLHDLGETLLNENRDKLLQFHSQRMYFIAERERFSQEPLVGCWRVKSAYVRVSCPEPLAELSNFLKYGD